MKWRKDYLEVWMVKTIRSIFIPGLKTLGFQCLANFFVILIWSLAMGWLLSLATHAHGAVPASEIGTVDVVPAEYQLGQKLYLENCSSCHIAIPPSVLPSQTWKNLLQDEQHYGARLKPLVDPPRILVWRYLSTFSRPHKQEERTPYRVNKSRFFNALHPQVELQRPVQLGSCVSCHSGAREYNFRTVSSVRVSVSRRDIQ